MPVLSTIFGLCLILAAGIGIFFGSAFGGLGTGPQPKDHVFAGLIAAGVLGPPLVLGTYYAALRWVVAPSADVYIAVAMLGFVLVGTLLLWVLIPTRPDVGFHLGYTVAAIVSLLVCAALLHFART